MPRYIDADKLEEATKNKIAVDHGWCKATIDEDFIDLIHDADEADVQEVVRCKDCIYFAEDRMKCPYCDYWESVTGKEDFCSNGMQMEGDKK